MAEPILAGVPSGGMKEIYEVKILVCYLLESVRLPLTRENICEICCTDGLVDYFTLCTALQELEQNGNISPLGLEESAAYVLTPLGMETVEKLKKALPSSLRDEIVRKALAILRKIRRENEISTSIRADGTGYQVQCALHEGLLDFFSVTFYAPDLEQAHIIEENLKEKASDIYEQLILKLTS